MEPWQEKILVDIETGWKSGELAIMTSSRRTGKSVMSNVIAAHRLLQDLLDGDKRISSVELGEGTVYGSRYYTVQLIGGNWGEIEKWCRESFGQGCSALWGEKKAPDPARRWYMNNRKFWFRDIKDRDWFLLRWQPTVGSSE